MRPLFPKWSNSLFRWSLAAGACALLAVPALAMAVVRTPYETGQDDPKMQPIKFDHRHHVRDDGIDCRYCHSGVERSAYAGIPATSVCMGCHAQIWTSSPELRAVRDSWAENRRIPWERVNALPRHVFFDHSIHVAKGVGCVTCHGRIDLMGQVYQAAPLAMGWCLDCHRDPAAYVRPREEVTNMEWTPSPRTQEQVGREVVKALDVRPTTDCSGCHR